MKILFTGDFFYDYDDVNADFQSIINQIEVYDKVFINYEGSFSGNEKRKKSISLTMSEKSLVLPRNTSLILCNNHITDFGSSGIENTKKKITENNLDCFGLNSTSSDKSHIKKITINETNLFIATLGWSNEECIPASKNYPGIKPLSSKSINELKVNISYLKNYFKILYIHAGYEWEKYPLPDHVGLAREAIDSGFDFVYFCHSHTVQDYEFYNNKLIHYGLGNFYFSSLRSNFPDISDLGCCLILDTNHINNYHYRNIRYDRKSNISILENEIILKRKSLIFPNLEEYAKKYKKFRTRKKNPRPILYYNQPVRNYLKFRLWKCIVDFLGIINMRLVIKKLLNWN